LRWRHLTAAISDEPVPVGALYRATAVGFMTINLLPLRLGELVRPWMLARETSLRASTALGTLVLERALDFTALAAVGAAVLYFHTRTLPEWVQAGAVLLLAMGCIPFLLALALRRDEPRTLALLSRFVHVLPERLALPVHDVVVQVCRGLDSLRGRHAIAMVGIYTALLWGLLFSGPFALGLLAFRIDLSPGDVVLATFTAHAFTALAIAAPSAPGFFGVYHFACREALALFGVPSALAVAYGTLVHVGYWVPVTAAGLLAAAASGARMRDLVSPDLGKAPPPAAR
jgi:uncharacterized membrane protein YbhN (UPF0104 family)